MNPAIISGVFSLGKDLISRWWPDKDEQAKREAELMVLMQSGELKELETRMSAIIAEANSKDKWTSRARPSFMYLFYLVIVCLVMIFPVLGIWWPEQMNVFYDNVADGFDAIPEPMWWTFTTGYLGYAGFRTYEKGRGVAK